MMHKNTLRRSIAVVLGAALAAPMTASAAGFHLIEQGNRGLGHAYAGSAALGDDASTIYFNPAAMSRLDRDELLFGVAVIDLQGDFTKESATDATGQPLSGGEGGDVGDGASPVPNFYYHRVINDDWNFGLGIGAPFGLATSYDDDSIFRYQARLSDVSIINVNPSLSYKIDDQWSLGFGLNVQYMEVELTNAVDFGAVCFDQVDPTTCSALGLRPQEADGSAQIKGDGVGYGFNVGALWEGDQTRVGIHYRSQVKHDLTGDARFGVPEEVPPQIAAAFSDGRVDAGFRAPDSLSVSVAHELDDRWTLLGDVTWMGWSTFDELRVEYRNPETQGGEDTVEEQNYQDDMRYSVGFDYRHNDRWTLRAGLAYDESPVDDQYRTPRLPDDDRTWFSFGATFKQSPNSEWDFAYTHLMLDDDISLDHDGSQGDNIVGTYEVSANIVGVSYRYLFD
ncbi:long-chain fatty acid transport protein [Natronospira proteinivora]|uniref:Long-chain fatty acid transport protein n=1 Tax=Natronospira proteinivora TaxID=1807133 RepID=A0ABT1G5C1_9GAMM|nr:outer membrane protein transport protein [Natronospira proteinivora]MCP1726480.1 long-chain fatty acid transport protein [Natronospira proteinivora]